MLYGEIVKGLLQLVVVLVHINIAKVDAKGVEHTAAVANDVRHGIFYLLLIVLLEAATVLAVSVLALFFPLLSVIC